MSNVRQNYEALVSLIASTFDSCSCHTFAMTFCAKVKYGHEHYIVQHLRRKWCPELSARLLPMLVDNAILMPLCWLLLSSWFDVAEEYGKWSCCNQATLAIELMSLELRRSWIMISCADIFSVSLWFFWITGSLQDLVNQRNKNKNSKPLLWELKTTVNPLKLRVSLNPVLFY